MPQLTGSSIGAGMQRAFSLSAEKSGSARSVLIVVSHVVQYASPLFQILAADPRLDLQVAYCSLQGAERGWDHEFNMEVQWDEPLLHGYPWSEIPNKAAKPGLGRFFGLWNPGLWKLIRSGRFDAVVIYTGYMYASFWLAVAAAKSKGVAVLISSDSTTLVSRDGSKWKTWLKPMILACVYRTADVLMSSAPAIRKLARTLGIPPGRIVEIGSGMNKEEWQNRAARFSRSDVRSSWNIPDDARVVCYCAKLQEWKRPLDLVRAFARANLANAYLVMAGEGPQRAEVELAVDALGIRGRTRILGFVNASQLPGVYKASDLFVLPSWYDPCPLVVPEAMFSGLPVILSDTVLGRLCMIDQGKSGYIYRCGDTEQLARLLQEVLSNPQVLATLQRGVAEQMKQWTAQDFVDSWIKAVETAVRRKKRDDGRGSI
jgi:glycosyltransferase involved in cell wall biosynthesis